MHAHFPLKLGVLKMISGLVAMAIMINMDTHQHRYVHHWTFQSHHNMSNCKIHQC